MDAAGLDTTQAAVKLKQWRAKEADFLRQTGRRRDSSRSQIGTFGRSEAGKATWKFNKAVSEASELFHSGSPAQKLAQYVKEKPIIDKLSSNGIKYIERISDTELIVNAGTPTIRVMRQHAVQNLFEKSDRAEMTLEQAQNFVDNSKLTLYQQNRETIKFLANDGYAVINFDHELVTAVPQKWRKKYNKYIGGE